MTDWKRIQEEFTELCDLDPSARDRRLSDLKRRDPILAKEVSSLLAHAHEAETGFMETPLSNSLGELAKPVNLVIGQQLGSYTLDAKIAEGGMGVVYSAHRDDGVYDRDVAVKVLREEIASPETKERFRIERQTLAQLQHPAIATMLEGGSTPDDRPYLVMELIEGEPIDDYCRERNLPLRDRLGLFLEVCDGVSHAHDRLVIHRDLKPNNILVTLEGHPKLLDFGIAKIMGVASDGSVQTRLPPLTPQYASPEQVRGELVTVASDVYSLGILLYELLTDHHPYREFKSWTTASRAVCEVEPPPPSRQLEGKGGPVTSRELHGDLDTIIRMAIRKEPERRYASVRELAGDVRLHLEGRAVVARADSAWYRGTRFMRRHRLALASAVLILISASLGVAGIVRQAEVARREERRAVDAEREARVERDRAIAASRQARTLSEFWEGLVTSAQPGDYGPDLPLRIVLDKAAASAHVGLEDLPRSEASLRHVIGRTYLALGLFDSAEMNLRRGAELLEGLESGTRAMALDVRIDLARALCELKRGDESDAILDDVSAALGDGQEEDDRRVRIFEVYAANDFYLDRPDSARENILLALELLSKSQESQPTREASMRSTLASIEFSRGNLEEALEMAREAVGLYRHEGLEESPDALRVRVNLAAMLQASRLYEEAAEEYEETLDLAVDLLGDQHPDVGTLLHNFAFMQQSRDELEHATDLAEQALEIRAEALGDRDERTLSSKVLLAVCYKKQGVRDEAIRLLEEARLYSDDVPWDLTSSIEQHLASLR